jgi:hypothetical protein
VNDQELQQRINYLIEHGGLWEDPLDDLRQQVTAATWLTRAALALVTLDIALHAL